MASGYSDMSEITKARQAYALHQKPPMINLLNEKPRRESVVEQQLRTNIIRPNFGQPQQQVGSFEPQHQHQQQQRQQQQLYQTGSQYGSQYPIAGSSQTATNTYSINNSPASHQASYSTDNYNILSELEAIAQGNYGGAGNDRQVRTVTTTVKTDTSRNELVDPIYSSLVDDLGEKSAKLKREIAYMNQHLSPWAKPRQIREPRREPEPRVTRSDQRWVKECPSTPGSRPTSRASSTRSNTEADLMDKAAKLLQDAEEIEKKPLKAQQIVIETGNRASRSPTESTSPQPGASSVHTAIITVPKGEVDNKSPLPFSYDNFSTLGVRGNIASVGAAEPEKPYAPIYPIVKRTPSPLGRRA